MLGNTANAIAHPTHGNDKQVPAEKAFHSGMLDQLRKIRMTLTTAASYCCSKRRVERATPTCRLSATTEQFELPAQWVDPMKLPISIATTRDVPTARSQRCPCEVELLGESSPLDCFTVEQGSRHDTDHDFVAPRSCARPVDLDAKRARSAMQIKRLGLDAPAALDAPSDQVLSELPPRAATEHIASTYTCYSARDWASHDDNKQQEVFVLFLAVLMLLIASAVSHERGTPTTRAVTETAPSFGEAQHMDVDVRPVGNHGSTPVCDEGGFVANCTCKTTCQALHTSSLL